MNNMCSIFLAMFFFSGTFCSSVEFQGKTSKEPLSMELKTSSEEKIIVFKNKTPYTVAIRYQVHSTDELITVNLLPSQELSHSFPSELHCMEILLKRTRFYIFHGTYSYDITHCINNAQIQQRESPLLILMSPESGFLGGLIYKVGIQRSSTTSKVSNF
ncbi:hypothetical protein H0X06_04760 [Candidatus Dependentiae bacterium]|nr:hypothetical protein [Candidatus Dependentiae bacterium]